MNKVSEIVKKYPIYYWGWILLALGMPLSVFLMSVAQFLIVGYWILSGDFKTKLQRLKSNKAFWFFALIILVHLIGLIYTQDFHYAANDLRIKLPLFALPLLACTLDPFPAEKIKNILLALIISVTIGTLYSLLVLFGFTKHVVTDIREISIFISHIRFSLLINVCIVVLTWFLWSGKYQWGKFVKIALWLVMAWLAVYLFILQSFTGIVIFLILIPLLLVYWTKRKVSKKISLIVTGFILAGIAYCIFVFASVLSDFKEKNIKLLERTPDGGYYYHDTLHNMLENGYPVLKNICEPEMKAVWSSKSTFPYEGNDRNGQPLRYTLMRYLSSKGLTKDKRGISKLSDKEFTLIEDGCTNYRYNDYTFQTKVYKLLWEVHSYRVGGNPSGLSLAQRVEYLKASFGIIERNWLIGIGTGDLKLEFQKEYNRIKSPLDEQWRNRAHNQFVTFFLTFGLIGFLIIMLAIFYPVVKSKAYKNYIFGLYFLIFLLSMLNEDTLETQAGVTFFIYFYTLFVFADAKSRLREKH